MLSFTSTIEVCMREMWYDESVKEPDCCSQALENVSIGSIEPMKFYNFSL